MTSDSTYTQFFKHGLLLFAALFIIIGINGYYTDDVITINGEMRKIDIYELAIFFAVGLLFVIIWLMYKDKVVKIRLEGNQIVLIDGSEEQVVDWIEVKTISKLRFITPPVYKMKLRDSDDTYLFLTKPYFVTVGFWSWDISKMGSEIRGKKRKLKL